jgi:hypothetical protein
MHSNEEDVEMDTLVSWGDLWKSLNFKHVTLKHIFYAGARENCVSTTWNRVYILHVFVYTMCPLMKLNAAVISCYPIVAK